MLFPIPLEFQVGRSVKSVKVIVDMWIWICSSATERAGAIVQEDPVQIDAKVADKGIPDNLGALAPTNLIRGPKGDQGEYQNLMEEPSPGLICNHWVASRLSLKSFLKSQVWVCFSFISFEDKSLYWNKKLQIQRFNITGQAKAKKNSASSSCYFTAAVDHRVINLYTNNYVLFSSSAHTSLHHHDESLSAVKKTFERKPD